MKYHYNLELKEGVDFFVKRNHWIPKRMGVDYFAFGKTLYFKNSEKNIPRHEFLHIAQFHKFGTSMVIGHYIYHLVKNLFKFKKFPKAFVEIPFEVEARNYEAEESRITV